MIYEITCADEPAVEEPAVVDVPEPAADAAGGCATIVKENTYCPLEKSKKLPWKDSLEEMVIAIQAEP